MPPKTKKKTGRQSRATTPVQQPVYDSSKGLFIEVKPDGQTLTDNNDIQKRFRIIHDLLLEYFPSQQMKHVYFNTCNDDLTSCNLKKGTGCIDFEHDLFEQSQDANALLAAVLKVIYIQSDLLLQSKQSYISKKTTDVTSDGNMYNSNVNKGVCNSQVSNSYFYDELITMFKSGGCFLMICDYDSRNILDTIRIRALMLSIYVKPVVISSIGGGAGNRTATIEQPRKLDDYVQEYFRQLASKPSKQGEIKYSKNYFKEHLLSCNVKVPDYDQFKIRNSYVIHPHNGRLHLQAICIKKVDEPNPIVTVNSDKCLRFLDNYACLCGIREIRLESLIRTKNYFKPDTILRSEIHDERTLEIGDWVEINSCKGVVECIHGEDVYVRQWTIYKFFSNNLTKFKISEVNVNANANANVRGKPKTVRKLNGFFNSNDSKPKFLHELYYRNGYDFEESNQLYTPLSLRKYVYYPKKTWLYHKDSAIFGRKIDPDDKYQREQVLSEAVYMPTNYIDRIDENYIKTNSDCNTPENVQSYVTMHELTMKDIGEARTCIPMVRRVTGKFFNSRPRSNLLRSIRSSSTDTNNFYFTNIYEKNDIVADLIGTIEDKTNYKIIRHITTTNMNTVESSAPAPTTNEQTRLENVIELTNERTNSGKLETIGPVLDNIRNNFIRELQQILDSPSNSPKLQIITKVNECIALVNEQISTLNYQQFTGLQFFEEIISNAKLLIEDPSVTIESFRHFLNYTEDEDWREPNEAEANAEAETEHECECENEERQKKKRRIEFGKLIQYFKLKSQSKRRVM